jgi:hypothetical protein
MNPGHWDQKAEGSKPQGSQGQAISGVEVEE